MRNLIKLIEKEVLLKKGIYRCEIIQKETKTFDQDLVVFVLGTREIKCSDMEGQLSRQFEESIRVVQLTAFPLDENGSVNRTDMMAIPVFNKHTSIKFEKEYDFLEIGASKKEVFATRKLIPLIPERLAIAHGPEFPKTTSAKTLTKALQEASIEPNNKRVHVIDAKGVESVISYSELYDKALSIALNFSKKKSDKQIPIIIQMPNVHEYLEVFWASLCCNIPSIPFAIPKKYENSDPLAKKMLQTLEQFEHVFIVCPSDKKSEINSLLSETSTNNTVLISYEELIDNRIDKIVGNEFEEPKLDDIALYLMTSGSTGAPKLVPQTHRRIMLRSLGTIEANNMSQDDVSLNWLPLDHVGGLVMFHIRDVISKCEQLQVNTRFILEKPIRWLELCDKHDVNLSWAPNFAFNLINSFEKDIINSDLDLSSLRFIMNSGEQIIASQVFKFLKILKPKGLSDRCIFPAWGMSETCSAVFFNNSFSSNSTHDRYVSVGKPIMGIQTRIVNDQNQLLNEGVHGRLQVKGSCILEAYFNRPNVNAASFTEDQWFDTGDIAYIKDGAVAIVGRNKDILIINGSNLSCHEIEEYIDTITGVERSFTAVVPFRKNDGATDSCVVFIHTKYEEGEQKSLIKQIRKDISKSFGFNPDKILCVAKEQIPKTSIGKIQKGKLSKALEEGGFGNLSGSSPTQNDSNTSELPTVMQRIWERSSLEEAVNIKNDKPEVLVFSHGKSAINFSDFGNQLINVNFGIDYKESSSFDFTIDKENEEHIIQLFQRLEDDHSVSVIILENSIDKTRQNSSTDTQEQSLFLLRLVKAIKKTTTRKISILFVSQFGQKVFENEKIHLEVSPQIAFLRSVDAEMRNIECKYIDVDGECNGTLLLREIDNNNLFEKEIVYRKSKRYTVKLEEVNVPRSTNSFFEKDKLYVIIGGLGGIALSLITYLLENEITNILLVGRTKQNDLSSKQHQKLDDFEEKGVSVKYVSLDILEYSNCIELIKKSKYLYGKSVEAIFNLAAYYLPKEIHNLKEVHIKKHYEAKVFGSWNLYRLCNENNIASLINFSSVNGFFGGTGAAAYAAANRYQEALSLYKEDNNNVEVTTIAWSMWQKIGLSESMDFIELSTRKGFTVLSPSDGFAALEAILSSNYKNVIVGLDSSNLNILPYLCLVPENLFEIKVVSRNLLEIEEAKKILKDPYGVYIPIASLEYHEGSSPNNVDSDGQVHSGDVKEYVKNIYKELLRIDDFDESEDFFELGGSSLIIPQLYNRILEEFKIEIEIDDLYERGTVLELSEVINQKKIAPNKV